MISNACAQGSCEDDTFNSWYKTACNLRPSVLSSPKNTGVRSKLRAHWQGPKSTNDFNGEGQSCEETNGDSDLASPRCGFRQHILQQVKMKLGAAVGPKRSKSRSTLQQQAKPQAAIKECFAATEPGAYATPAKMPPRPKAPAYPGARGPKAHVDQEYCGRISNSITIESFDSDGIYEDDGSSGCDSDF
jgi:hypothetical protein